MAGLNQEDIRLIVQSGVKHTSTSEEDAILESDNKSSNDKGRFHIADSLAPKVWPGAVHIDTRLRTICPKGRQTALTQGWGTLGVVCREGNGTISAPMPGQMNENRSFRSLFKINWICCQMT